jgi:hypothetical protein
MLDHQHQIFQCLDRVLGDFILYHTVQQQDNSEIFYMCLDYLTQVQPRCRTER